MELDPKRTLDEIFARLTLDLVNSGVKMPNTLRAVTIAFSKRDDAEKIPELEKLVNNFLLFVKKKSKSDEILRICSGGYIFSILEALDQSDFAKVVYNLANVEDGFLQEHFTSEVDARELVEGRALLMNVAFQSVAHVEIEWTDEGLRQHLTLTHNGKTEGGS